NFIRRLRGFQSPAMNATRRRLLGPSMTLLRLPTLSLGFLAVASLTAAPEPPATAAAKAAFLRQVDARFDKWDANSDGILTDAEIAMTSSNESDGLWVNVYEKAAGQARNDLKPDGERLGSAIDALAKGGSAGTMLAFITGHEIVRFSCKFAKEEKTTPREFA